jgi:hypothetical protein
VAYPPNQVRMAHIGWEIDDPAHLVSAFDHVIEFELFTPGATGEPGFAPLDIDALRAIAVG